MADIFYVDEGYVDAGYAVYTADASILYQRAPKTLTPSGNVTTSATQYKFGSKSIYFDGTGDYLTSPAHPEFEFTTDFEIGMWMYVPSGTPPSSSQTIFDQRTSSATQPSWWLNMNVPSGTGAATLYGHFNGATRINAGAVLTRNTWNYLVFSRKGTRNSIWLNGSEVGAYINSAKTPGNALRIGADYSGATNFQGYIDEFYIVKGLSQYTYPNTYSNPTTEFVEGATFGGYTDVYPVLLLHGEGSNIIDGSGKTGVVSTTDIFATTVKAKNSSATLSSNFQVTAYGGKTQKVTKTLSAVFTISNAIGSIGKFATSTLASAATISKATGVRNRKGTATLSSAFTQTISATKRTRNGTATLSAVSTVTKATPTRIRRITKSVSAIFSLSNVTKRTRTVSKTLSAAFSVTDVTRRIRTVTQTISGAFSTSMVTTVGHARYAQATLSSAFTQSTQANKIFGASATLIASSVSLTATPTRLRPGTSSITVTASVSNTINRTRNISKTLSATATLSKATPERVRPGSKTMSATATLTAKNTRIYRGTVLVFPTFTINAKANAIYRLGTRGELPSIDPIVGEISAVDVDSTRFVTANVDTYYGFRPFASGSKVALPVISIWMKGTGTLVSWGVPEGLYDTDDKVQVSFTVNNTDITLSGTNTGSGQPDGFATGSWAKPADDGEWHHYFIVRTGSGTGDTVDVWQDGTFLTGSGSFSTYMSSAYGGHFGIGTSKSYNSSSPYYADRTSWANACFAQVWIGYIDRNDTGWNDPGSWVNEFYHQGAVNLSASTTYSKTIPSNGVTGTPALVFDKLTYPFSSGDCDFWVSNSDAHGDKGYKVTTPGPEFICSPGWISDNALNLESNFGCFFGLSRIKTFTATLPTTASIRAVTGPVKQFRATLSSSFTVSKAQAASTQQAYATGLTVTTAITKAQSNPVKTITKTLSSEFSQRARSTTAVFGQAHLSSAFSQRTVTSASSKGKIVVASSIYAYTVKTRQAVARLPVTATMNANGGLFFNGQFNIQPVFTLRAKLTIVPIPDDLQTLFVSSETRGLRVLPETRFAVVEPESNLNRILPETRDMIVPYESRTIREAVNPAFERTTERIRRLPA